MYKTFQLWPIYSLFALETMSFWYMFIEIFYAQKMLYVHIIIGLCFSLPNNTYQGTFYISTYTPALFFLIAAWY